MALILQLPVDEHAARLGDSVAQAPSQVRPHGSPADSAGASGKAARPTAPAISGSDTTAVADSVAADTAPGDTLYYIMLDPPEVTDLPANHGPQTDGWGMSWILTSLTVLFVIVAIRFRSNSKYLSALFRDAVEVRERRNVFDETVREESFMLILNVLWCLSVGVLLYTLIQYTLDDPEISASLRAFIPGAIPDGGWGGDRVPQAIAISIGVTMIWQI